MVYACFRRVRLFKQLKRSKFWQRARTAVLSARVQQATSAHQGVGGILTQTRKEGKLPERAITAV